MKTSWIVVAALVVVLVVAGVTAVNVVEADDAVEENSAPSCGASCGNSCTAESNCGRASCGAVSGSGGCGCK
jgi:hypothetical protein